MKARVLTFLAILLALSANARPGSRRPIQVKQPDGSVITIVISGDEHRKLVSAVDGTPLQRDGNGFYVPVRKAAPETSSTSRRVMRPSGTEAGLTQAHRAIIILAQFPDLEFTFTKENFENMLNQDGYAFGGGTGCARQYFEDQFGEGFSFIFDVSPIVTLSRGYAEYGGNTSTGEDKDVCRLVSEACRAADAEGVDFSLYDDDSDGLVDNVFVFVAGGDEADGAGEDHIWSHSYDIRQDGFNLVLDGKTIGPYAMSTELMADAGSWTYKGIFAGIGTFCHEYSHVLGLMDIYDTDYEESGGLSDATWGSNDLMDSGSYNNGCNTPPSYTAIELDCLGLGTCKELTAGRHTLKPISDSRTYYKQESSNPGEYYLFECRARRGWDRYIEGSGMLVYHIDKSSNKAGVSKFYKMTLTAKRRWEVNEINCNPAHQCADLIEATPGARSASQVFFPAGSNNQFGPESTPAFAYWDGSRSDRVVSGITKNSDGSVSFAVGRQLEAGECVCFQDAAIINWTSEDDGECSLTTDSGIVLDGIRSYEPGMYACVIEGLKPGTAYRITISTASGASVSTEIKTRPYYKTGKPFIYLEDCGRLEDGSFAKGSGLPLRVYNTPDAVSVKWSFGGKAVKPGPTGYLILGSGGTLRAEISHSDGSTQVIIKEIKVR